LFVAPNQQVVTAPQSPLERQLIIDYLEGKGYQLEDLKKLPTNLVKELMTAASIHASLRLTEIEARSQFRRKIQFKD
jgi:hypothetical protein